MTKTGNLATIVISVICLALWVATTVYYVSWDTKETHWDLMSWSCKHAKAEASYNHVNYGEICTEMVSILLSYCSFKTMVADGCGSVLHFGPRLGWPS